MEEKDFKRLVMPATILVFALVSFFIIQPILIWIALGLTLAYILNPVYERLNKKLNLKYLSASIILVTTLLLIILPAVILLPITARQVLDVYVSVSQFDAYPLFKTITPFLLENPIVSAEIQAATSHMKTTLSTWLLSYIKDTLMNLPNILLGILIIMFTFFFSMIEGGKFKEYFFILFPFPKHYQEKFYERFNQVTDSVIYGHITVGLVQGLICGLGYYLLGVPQAFLLTVLSVVAGVLPVVGPWLVWIPMDIYLFATGQNGVAMGLLIFGLFVINWIDTILRPQIVANKAEMNSAIALIGTIGGLYAFGIIGILIGPLVLAYFILLVEINKDRKMEESIVVKAESSEGTKQ